MDIPCTCFMHSIRSLLKLDDVCVSFCVYTTMVPIQRSFYWTKQVFHTVTGFLWFDLLILQQFRQRLFLRISVQKHFLLQHLLARKLIKVLIVLSVSLSDLKDNWQFFTTMKNSYFCHMLCKDTPMVLHSDLVMEFLLTFLCTCSHFTSFRNLGLKFLKNNNTFYV